MRRGGSNHCAGNSKAIIGHDQTAFRKKMFPGGIKTVHLDNGDSSL